MGAYAEAYLSDVVENQGKLFDYVAETFPDKDTEDFINFYMQSNTRKSIDESQAYVNDGCKNFVGVFLQNRRICIERWKSTCWIPSGLGRRILCILSVVL